MIRWLLIFVALFLSFPASAATRPAAHGAVPGYRPVALGSGASISISSAWRGRWADITGYHSVGARTYDPVSGRWLSFDPAWNEADPNGSSAFGGDPINFFDSSGRTSRLDYDSQGAASATASGQTWISNYSHDPTDPGAVSHPIEIAGQMYTQWFVADGNGGGSFILTQLGNPSAPANRSVLASVSDSVLNTEARNYAAEQWNQADWDSGWGATMKFAAGVDYAANTFDAGANLIPIIGGVKSVVENGVKTVVKDVAKTFTEDAAKTVEENLAAKTAPELLLDSNVVIGQGKQFLASGQNIVKASVSDVEIASLVRQGRISMPGAANQIPSVANSLNVDLRINVRGLLTPKLRGNFADGIIGATSIERGSTLISQDQALIDAVNALGGAAMKP